MKTETTILKILAVLFCTIAVVALTGCHEMKVETIVDADGSGTRTIKLTVESDGEDPKFTLADYTELMGVGEDRGWTHEAGRKKKDKSGEIVEIHTFEHAARAGGIQGLTAMSGDILIRGTNRNPVFDGVFFTNAIEMETGVNTRGRTIAYREVFSWSALTGALVDYRLENYREPLMKSFPGLTREEINEWFAFFKGTFMAAVDDGIFDMGSGDRERRYAKSIDRVVEFAMKMIRRHDPGADDAYILSVTWSLFVEWDEFEETAEDMDLLGVVLASGLNLVVRVDIPGRIVETNADRRESYQNPLAGRQKLVWEIDPTETFSKPLEIYVKSEIPDR